MNARSLALSALCRESTSTGFIISGRRILTNAHCVEMHSQVTVRRRGSVDKHIAKVLAIGKDCDIAMLTVEDPEFWAADYWINIDARNTLPKLEEHVAVIGFPVGGENLSVTAGVVSRIDVQEYAFRAQRLLAIQVDASINPGNSGGPVLDSDRNFVGIAFQSLANADGVGYIIPLPVIYHFLDDLARHDGRFTGFPDLLFKTQTLENKAHRRYLGLPDGVTGSLVAEIDPLSPCTGKVKSGDVLVEIGGWKVGYDNTVEFESGTVFASDGALGRMVVGGQEMTVNGVPEMATSMIPSSNGERIDADFVVTQLQTDDTITLTLFNKNTGFRKEVIQLCVPLSHLVSDEGTRERTGRPQLKLPSYRIIGGLVLTVLTFSYLSSELTALSDSPDLFALCVYGMRKQPDEEIVLAAHVLNHDSNVGYEGAKNMGVDKINGIKLLNLKQASKLLDEAVKFGEAGKEIGDEEKRYIRLDVAFFGFMMVIDTWTVRKDTEEVLEMHMVPSDRSEDLVEVE